MKVLLAKIFGGALTALAGFSVGREGPSIQIGAMSGKLETYINGNLVSIMEIKNSIPEGEAKMFYPSGKLLSIFNGIM